MTRISYLNLTENDMKDQLTARYQSYSIAQLLKVLENKAEYTSVAIEVAETEWDNRHIAQEEFNKAKEELDKKKQAESRQQHQLTLISEKTGNFLAQVYHDINPTTNRTPQKAIALGFRFCFNCNARDIREQPQNP